MLKKKMMKNTMIAAMVLVAALSVSGCGKKGNAASETTKTETIQTEQETSGAQIANPWTDVTSVEEAEKMTGFPLEFPEMPEKYGKPAIRVLQSEEQPVFELIWRDAEDKEIRIRKAPGTDDISGDYNEYKKQDTINDGNLEVKGNDDGMYLAVWNDQGYTYSVYVENGCTEEELSQLVEKIR